MPERANAKPVCIICQETVSTIKSGNVKRHFETKHKEYNGKFPPESALRASKIASLKASLQASTAMMTKSTTVQENATEASLRVIWILGRHKKSLKDAEIVKECMIAASSALYSEKKNVEMVQQIPLSDSTASRRSDDLAENVFDQLLNDLKKAESFSIACDESTDKTAVAQFCVFVRFFNGNQFVEDLLALIPLKEQTRGEHVYAVCIIILLNWVIQRHIVKES